MTPAFPDTELIERLKMAALVDSAIGRYYDHNLLMAAVARLTALEKQLGLNTTQSDATGNVLIEFKSLSLGMFKRSPIPESLGITDVQTGETVQFVHAQTTPAEPLPILTPEYSYAEHAHAERWSGPFNSIVEAITEALGEYVPDQDKVVYVGENEPVEINCDSLAEEVIERIQEQAEEQVGEVADSIGPFDEKERKPLADAIEAWVNEHAQLTCWTVERAKAYRPGDVEYEAARAMTLNVKESN